MIRSIRFRGVLTLAAVLASISTFGIGTSGAQFSATTTNASNHAASITIDSPANLTASLSFVLLDCRADLDWDPGATVGVTQYEVKRIRISNGAVLNTVVTSSTDFSETIGVTLLGQPWRWEVRSILGAWKSAPATIEPSNGLLCLL